MGKSRDKGGRGQKCVFGGGGGDIKPVLADSILNLGTRSTGMAKLKPWPLYPQRKSPQNLFQRMLTDCSVGANDVKKGNCVGRSSPLQVQGNQQRQAGNSAHLAARRRSTLSAYYCMPRQSSLAYVNEPKAFVATSGYRNKRHGSTPAYLPPNVTPPRHLAYSGDRITC